MCNAGGRAEICRNSPALSDPILQISHLLLYSRYLPNRYVIFYDSHVK